MTTQYHRTSSSAGADGMTLDVPKLLDQLESRIDCLAIVADVTKDYKNPEHIVQREQFMIDLELLREARKYIVQLDKDTKVWENNYRVCRAAIKYLEAST